MVEIVIQVGEPVACGWTLSRRVAMEASKIGVLVATMFRQDGRCRQRPRSPFAKPLATEFSFCL